MTVTTATAVSEKQEFTLYKFRAELTVDALGYIAALQKAKRGVSCLELNGGEGGAEVSFRTTASLEELIGIAWEARKDWHRIAQTIARWNDYTSDWLRCTEEDTAELVAYSFRADADDALEFIAAIDNRDLHHLYFDRETGTTSFRTRIGLERMRRFARRGNWGPIDRPGAVWPEIAETLAPVAVEATAVA